jgi:hypothetical protein
MINAAMGEHAHRGLSASSVPRPMAIAGVARAGNFYKTVH